MTCFVLCLYERHDDDDHDHYDHVKDSDNRNDEDHCPKDALCGVSNLSERDQDDIGLLKLSEQHGDLGRVGRSKDDSTRVTSYGMFLSFLSRIVYLVSVCLYWLFSV